MHAVDFSPFARNLYLSAGLDGTVRWVLFSQEGGESGRKDGC